MSPTRSPTSQRHRVTAVGLLVVAALGLLVFKGLSNAVVYFKTADEAVAQRASLGNSNFQLEGTVVRGTVQPRGRDTYLFTVESGGVKVRVDNSGNPPQLFRPGLPVVVVGHFVGSSDLFASDEIMVKHSQSYVAAHPGRVRAVDGSSR